MSSERLPERASSLWPVAPCRPMEMLDNYPPTQKRTRCRYTFDLLQLQLQSITPAPAHMSTATDAASPIKLPKLGVWEFCATLSQEERYLSRLFKVFRIGGRFLHVCITSSLAYHNLTQRRFPFSIYKERNERNGPFIRNK